LPAFPPDGHGLVPAGADAPLATAGQGGMALSSSAPAEFTGGLACGVDGFVAERETPVPALWVSGAAALLPAVAVEAAGVDPTGVEGAVAADAVVAGLGLAAAMFGGPEVVPGAGARTVVTGAEVTRTTGGGNVVVAAALGAVLAFAGEGPDGFAGAGPTILALDVFWD
jgi:hypothetical protein